MFILCRPVPRHNLPTLDLHESLIPSFLTKVWPDNHIYIYTIIMIHQISYVYVFLPRKVPGPSNGCPMDYPTLLGDLHWTPIGWYRLVAGTNTPPNVPGIHAIPLPHQKDPSAANDFLSNSAGKLHLCLENSVLFCQNSGNESELTSTPEKTCGE